MTTNPMHLVGVRAFFRRWQTASATHTDPELFWRAVLEHPSSQPATDTNDDEGEPC